MQESWFERGKEKGNTVLEKVRNWRCIIRLRTLGFFFKKYIYNLNLTPNQWRLILILILVPKLHFFGISFN